LSANESGFSNPLSKGIGIFHILAEIVSNFGSFDMAQDRFVLRNFCYWRSFDFAQDMLCARHSIDEHFVVRKISNMFG